MKTKFLGKNVDFFSGKIVYNEFYVQENIPLTEQVENLKEDMLQVNFHKNLLLDVGWYPSFDINGMFRVIVVQYFDWEKPLYQNETSNLNNLYLAFLEAIEICKKISNE